MLGCFFVCVISGLLGLTAGINLNPESTVKFVPNWGSVGDWAAGISTFLTLLVACIAMNTWRVQERQRLALQFKADLIEYKNLLPHLKKTLVWPEDELQIQKAGIAFSACIKSYLIMIECIDERRKPYYEGIWGAVWMAHNQYIAEGATREATGDVLINAYLNKFV